MRSVHRNGPRSGDRRAATAERGEGTHSIGNSGSRHKHTPGQYADHGVKLDPETRLGSLLGEHAPVKSHHHQGFGRIGSGLREAAHADDGSVEALEDPSRRFTLGVLWHPEAGEDMRLFEQLVTESKRYREARG